ncbi:MAG: signal peptidase II [Pseudomonadaceae bacterium]|nr:signal peptidase II [Pseudomonadaceae bacterium]
MRYLAARWVGLLVALLVLVLDVVSKGYILAHAASLPWKVVDGFFAIVLAWNRGMSFSFLNDVGAWGPWVLGSIAVLASIWFVHWLGETRAWYHQWGLGMIIGGAVGNLLDRVQHGAVVDFLLVYYGDWTFPAFNVADSAITVGVVFLLGGGLWYKQREQKE